MNYSSFESLDSARSIVDEATLALIDSKRINSEFCKNFSTALVSSSAIGILTPLVAPGPLLVLYGGYRLFKYFDKKNKLKQEKFALYQEAIKKQNAIIEELKNELNEEKARTEYLMAINIQLQKLVKKLQEDLA